MQATAAPSRSITTKPGMPRRVRRLREEGLARHTTTHRRRAEPEALARPRTAPFDVRGSTCRTTRRMRPGADRSRLQPNVPPRRTGRARRRRSLLRSPRARSIDGSSVSDRPTSRMHGLARAQDLTQARLRVARRERRPAPLSGLDWRGVLRELRHYDRYQLAAGGWAIAERVLRIGRIMALGTRSGGSAPVHHCRRRNRDKHRKRSSSGRRRCRRCK
jgi:hypothetical protein